MSGKQIFFTLPAMPAWLTLSLSEPIHLRVEVKAFASFVPYLSSIVGISRVKPQCMPWVNEERSVANAF
jgi:hypothetical protein